MSWSPNSRSVWYPSLNDRVGYLLAATAKWGLSQPADYKQLFDREAFAGFTDYDEFKAGVADQGVAAVSNRLMDEAENTVKLSGVILRTPDEVARIQKRLRLGVPAERCRSIADVVNAAWAASEEPTLWADVPTMGGRKQQVMKDLVLKNLEVFEFEQVVHRP